MPETYLLFRLISTENNGDKIWKRQRSQHLEVIIPITATGTRMTEILAYQETSSALNVLCIPSLRTNK